MNSEQDKRIGWLAAHGGRLLLTEMALRLRRPSRLSAAEQERLLAAMLETGGLEAACRQAGVTLGMVLGERLSNPAFRRNWARAQQERRAILETLLTDLVLRGLLPDPEKTVGESREKFLAGLAQTLAERAAPAARGAKRTPEKTRAARPAAPSPGEADELVKLMQQVESRIAEAEVASVPK
ncbi:hypothetical protein L6Q21_02545 [Sandaracinobacter sp. RS1-74]|uniref:hypothetical protein n=1 Tax=Sandaracinobacteroides sayramensis TaxID=2913411 RepID=UPI001EDC4AA7|nr:hypothetical protein [Sandaracinobacteroides sayramensis]MCG2839861.1 hypothetical protein [Sandaracinobacteroides sayramensis]